jgi:hypothetical protein
MPKKTRPAPLGATYKQDVRLRWSRPKPDAALNGAERVLFNRGYEDFAPMELGATSQPSQIHVVFSLRSLRSFAAIPKLRDLCAAWPTYLPCIPNHSCKWGEVCSVVKFYGTIRI